jgi:hypothetical protein
MFDFATTTMSSAMPYVLPLMFALQPGASSVGVLREAAEQPQVDRRAVPLFVPTESSFHNFQTAIQNPSTISQSSAWVEAALEKIESYAGLPDGWRGEGSFAPTEQTLQEAAELLLQISAEMPDLPRPLISVDEEGLLAFTGIAPVFWQRFPCMATEHTLSFQMVMELLPSLIANLLVQFCLSD